MAIIRLRPLAAGLVLLLATLLPGARVGQASALSPSHTAVRAQAPPVPERFVPPAANRQPVGGPPPSTPFGSRHAGTRELTGSRTRTSRTFTTGNGDLVTRIAPRSINYLDAAGVYQPIDDTLVPTRARGYAYQNRANRYALYLPDDLAGAPVKVVAGQH